MSEPIKAGDLVMVVRWPCCNARIGAVYKVAELNNNDFMCGYCSCSAGYYGILARAPGIISAPLSWLKRIEPLSEPETVERKEEISA